MKFPFIIMKTPPWRGFFMELYHQMPDSAENFHILKPSKPGINKSIKDPINGTI